MYLSETVLLKATYLAEKNTKNIFTCQPHLCLHFFACLNRTQFLFPRLPSKHIAACFLQTLTAWLTAWNTHSDLLVTLHLPHLPPLLSTSIGPALFFIICLSISQSLQQVNRDIQLLILLPEIGGRTWSERRVGRGL